MGLYSFELNQELSGCGPEARFLLEAMVLRAQRDTAGDSTVGVKTLAKELHLSEKLVKDSLAELECARMVVCQRRATKQRGRPAVLYEVAPAAMRESGKEELVYGVNASLIVGLFVGAATATVCGSSEQVGKERTLTKGGRPAPPGAVGYLSACNRLLLATLLAHADQFGVVVGVSRKNLCQLTGLDALSLKHRLQRLMELELILTSISGLSSSSFSRVKVDSVYFLNVMHPRLEGRCAKIWCQKGCPDVHVPTHNQILGPDGDKKRNIPAVRRFLSRAKEPDLNMLQCMVLRYASYVLSSHSVDVVSAGKPIDDDSLRKKIASDFQRPRGWELGDDSCDRDWAQVIDHFYELAFKVARSFSQWINLSFDEVCLVPPDGRFQHILCLSMVENHKGDCAGGQA